MKEEVVCMVRVRPEAAITRMNSSHILGFFGLGKPWREHFTREQLVEISNLQIK